MTRYTKNRLKGNLFDAVVKQYVTDLELSNKSPNTIKAYTQGIQFFRAHLVEQTGSANPTFGMATNEMARDFFQELQAQKERYQDHPYHSPQEGSLSKFTVHKHYRSLRSFGKWLETNGYDDPFGKLPRMKRPKRGVIEILNEEEIAQLYNLYNPDTGYGSRWQALLMFLLGTGCRLNEVVGLLLSDVDIQKGRAKVLGKGDKERMVFFGPLANRPVTRYLNMFRPASDSPRLFLGLDGEALTDGGMEGIIRNARTKSGITRLHTHLLRHTFATRFLLNGGSEFDLQMLLGHEDLTMTREYVHLAKQLTGPGSMEHRRPDALDGVKLTETHRTGRRGRTIPRVRESDAHSD